MAEGKPLSTPEPSEPPASKRLDSWKEIAAYLKRDESTVRRWEKEGLPIRGKRQSTRISPRLTFGGTMATHGWS